MESILRQIGKAPNAAAIQEGGVGNPPQVANLPHHTFGLWQNRLLSDLERSESNPGENLSAAASQMLPLIYEELRRLARAYLRRERNDHTLQPTALVHEAYVRLAAQHNLDWENRVQVMALAASMMRRVLSDYADGRRAAKRPGSGVRIPFSESLSISSQDVDFLDLNSALDDLALLDERQARVVEMRFFSGMSIEEIATAMTISTATVERELRTARIWLMRRLAGQA
jgi:RNA polymerase sigma factor (TIGR02999 family)